MAEHNQRMQRLQSQQKEKQAWAGCDPVTLVAAAKESLYEIPQGQRTELQGPLEEVIARFEVQSRANLGTGIFSGLTGSPSVS